LAVGAEGELDRAMASPLDIDPAQLRYVSDAEAGIRRTGTKRFRYTDETGAQVRHRPTLDRIQALAVPPAWTSVWICADEVGHLQATGRDARARKQYRYHPAFRAVREHEKFADLIPFGEALPDLRRQIEGNLKAGRLDAEVVSSLAVALLDRTVMRVGNEAYARENRTYGLTTLRDRHAVIEGGAVSFRFAGKGGRRHELTVEDPQLARLVRRCRDLPGQQLLQWVDDEGARRPLRSEDVNDLLRTVTGLPITAKAFRTWHASVRAAALLAEAGEPASARQATSVVCEVVDEVAAELGNTRAVCRASYVHPAVVASFEDGVLGDWWRDGPTRSAGRCTVEERRLLVLLRKARRRGLGVARAKKSVRRAAKAAAAADTAAA
jgi:DNA topoisomerase I